MPTSFVPQSDFHRLARTGRARGVGVFRVSTEPAAAVSSAGRTVRFCFSDSSVDRMGDTINPNGWDTKDFLRNPVALWAHDSSQPPIGRASNIAVEYGRLMGDIEFAPAETYALADTIYRLVVGGFMKAVSVGFIPLEYTLANDPKRPWGVDFKRQELVEISLCPVPCNANALIEARSKGIDTAPVLRWAKRTLEAGSKERTAARVTPRATAAEELRRAQMRKRLLKLSARLTVLERGQAIREAAGVRSQAEDLARAAELRASAARWL